MDRWIVVAVVNAHTHKKEKKYIEKKKRKEEKVTTIYKSSEPTRPVEFEQTRDHDEQSSPKEQQIDRTSWTGLRFENDLNHARL